LRFSVNERWIYRNPRQYRYELHQLGRDPDGLATIPEAYRVLFAWEAITIPPDDELFDFSGTLTID
jgi:hypothetical protein